MKEQRVTPKVTLGKRMTKKDIEKQDTKDKVEAIKAKMAAKQNNEANEEVTSTLPILFILINISVLVRGTGQLSVTKHILYI